jgi:tetratricopeptide (TPR) repeat protein
MNRQFDIKIIVTSLALILLSDSPCLASIRVFFPYSSGCETLFNVYRIESNKHPARLERGANDYSAEVLRSESYVQDYYRKLMESGKYELFNKKAFEEFLAEDKLLPRDRSVFVEYRNPATGEIEGVMRAFFGFSHHENWRLIGVGQGGWGRGMTPSSPDGRLPMEYNQFKPGSGFFKGMKVELGRLVTREGSDRARIATELLEALLDTVFLPSIGKAGIYTEPHPSRPAPTMYVHTDLIRTRIYRKLGFKIVEVDRKATGLREGEFVMEAPIEEIYRLLKAGLDRSKREYNIDVSTGNLDAAIASIKEALSLHPTPELYAKGRQHLAELLLDKAQIKEAFVHAESAVKANPLDPLIVGTYLKALRMELGAFAPQSRSQEDLQRMRTRWNEAIDRILGNWKKRMSPLYSGETGYRRAILDPMAVVTYHQMLFELSIGNLQAALVQRSKFLESTGSSYDTLGWAGSSVVSREGTFRYSFRTSPRYQLEPWKPGKPRVFKVESDQASADYSFLQMRAGRIPGTGATADYHEASMQLAKLAGYHESAALHRQFKELILKADQGMQPSPY